VFKFRFCFVYSLGCGKLSQVFGGFSWILRRWALLQEFTANVKTIVEQTFSQCTVDLMNSEVYSQIWLRRMN
jgi:hypothetical protein